MHIRKKTFMFNVEASRSVFECPIMQTKEWSLQICCNKNNQCIFSIWKTFISHFCVSLTEIFFKVVCIAVQFWVHLHDCIQSVLLYIREIFFIFYINLRLVLCLANLGKRLFISLKNVMSHI